MRNNSLNKTVNEIGMSYTHYLEPKMPKIWGMAHNDGVSLEAMKKIVKNYVYNAVWSYEVNGQKCYTKKKWFIETMSGIETKEALYHLCNNSVKKAKETVAR